MVYPIALATLLIQLHIIASDELLPGTERGPHSSLSGIITKTDCLKIVKNGYHTEESVVFSTKGALECWQFCWISANCQHMQFDSFNGKCWLSDHEIDRKEKFSSILILSSKECFKGHLTYILENNLLFEKVLTFSKAGSGVRIRSTSAAGCLNVVGKVRANLNKVYQLAWETCFLADSWNFLKIENTVTDNKAIITVKISLSSNQLWCLYGEISGGFSGRLTLQYCHVTNITSSPVLEIYQISLSVGVNYAIAHIQTPMLLLEGESDGDTGLLNVSLLEPTPQHERPCYPTQFQIKDGAVDIKANQPFFLPGSAVTVMCHHGFGVKKLNYSAKQVVQCSEKPVKLLNCSVEAASNDYSEYCELFLCVAIALSVVLVVGTLFGVPMAIKHHKQARRLKRMEEKATTAMTK